MHILLIEDHLDTGDGLQHALKSRGITSRWVRRAADAPLRMCDAGFDCVLLDLSLPDGNGLDLLARWRREGAAVPVIVLTGNAEPGCLLAGLDGGADDFLVKPVAMDALASRIRAVVRRSAGQASELWTVGDLSIDRRGHAVRIGERPVELSGREFQLLVELARQPGAVVDKVRLATRLEPLRDPLETAAIEMHVSNLRKKIGAHRIRTVRGEGYLLVG